MKPTTSPAAANRRLPSLHWTLLFLLTLTMILSTAGAYAWWWNSDKDQTSAEQDTLTLDWEALVPADFQPLNPFESLTEDELQKLYDGSDESEREFQRLLTLMNYAPTVASLDGKRISIPGYVVPLDFDGQTRMSEFLLVPYFGACIHTPPPPANQIIYATSKDSVEIGDTYNPVILSGVLSVDTIQSPLAEAGYRLTIERVEEYKENY